MACNASLAAEPAGAGAGQWWALDCDIVDGQGAPPEEDDGGDGGGAGGPDAAAGGRAASPRGIRGPRLVAVLDRVQGGLIGATLSKFGVLGLYSVFIFSFGRSLRLG